MHHGTYDSIGCSLLTHNILYKPDKVQNGVGPTSLIVSASTKYFEEQYSDVLSVYMIRKNTARELGKNSNRELIYKEEFNNPLKPIVHFWLCHTVHKRLKVL